MGIRRRLSKPTRLLYHTLYGSLETPPLDPARCPEPWPANGALGVRVAYPIYGTKPMFPAKLKLDEHNVILGLYRNHDVERGGLGPGQGYSSWVATKIIYQGTGTHLGKPCQFVKQFWIVDPKTGKRTPIKGSELCGLFKFSSRSQPKRPFEHDHSQMGYRTQLELNLEEEALEGLYLDYEEIHGVKFPWNAMKYRHQRVD